MRGEISLDEGNEQRGGRLFSSNFYFRRSREKLGRKFPSNSAVGLKASQERTWRQLSREIKFSRIERCRVAEGAKLIVQVPPGRVLGGLVKLINPPQTLIQFHASRHATFVFCFIIEKNVAQRNITPFPAKCFKSNNSKCLKRVSLVILNSARFAFKSIYLLIYLFFTLAHFFLISLVSSICLFDFIN